MKILKLLFKYKLLRHLFEFIIWILTINIIFFLRKLFPESDTIIFLGQLILFGGFFYFLYVIYKLMPEREVQEEKGKKGTNPIAWLLLPTKEQKKLMAKQKRNAKARAKTLDKKGKHQSAQKERNNYRLF